MTKKLLITAAFVLAIGGLSVPEQASAAKASVCQFYRGDPLCKTISTTNCITVGAGVEGSHCVETTEYWYWS